jgi:hypothetical protein
MSSERNELVIPASRAKLVGLALGSACFVLVGAWLGRRRVPDTRFRGVAAGTDG